MKHFFLIGPALVLAACSGGGNGTSAPDTTQDVNAEVEVVADTADAGPDKGPDLVPDLGPDRGPDAQPEICTPDCTDRECGPDGCGATCGECTGEDQACSGEGKCVSATDCDAVCEGRECGTVGECECGTCEEGKECDEAGKCSCVPQCEGKNCGPDGCGGECGTCEDDAPCTPAGICQLPPDCEVKCEGKLCGDLDGCNCGTCAAGKKCGPDYTCVPMTCDDKCAGLVCGKIGNCVCGACPPGTKCSEDMKQCDCAPTCADPITKDPYECGDDGCGGSCGGCDGGYPCVDHFCCIPDCFAKACGTDGCDDTCGDCTGNEFCWDDGHCHVPCDPATLTFSPNSSKTNALAIGNGGKPGQALDVDNNPATCAPADECQDGLDNNFDSVVEQIDQFVKMNQKLTDMLNDGTLTMLVENDGFNANGQPFTINMYFGMPVQPKGVCNFQSAKCEYWVDPETFIAGTCDPFLGRFDNAVVTNGKIEAGGPGYVLVLSVPLIPGVPLNLPMHNCRITGSVTVNGNDVSTQNGIIGGAIPKKLLLQAVKDIPDGLELPVPKDTLLMLFDMMITNDIDTNGDGKKDACSIGIPFTTIPATIVGLAP